MRFKTHQEIDEHYAKQGLDVSKLQKEYSEMYDKLQEAICIVRKRKWIRFFYYNAYLGFGRLKPEVEIVYQDLKK